MPHHGEARHWPGVLLPADGAALAGGLTKDNFQGDGQYVQMQQSWWKPGFVINEGDAYFETQERGTLAAVASVGTGTAKASWPSS